MIINCMQDTAQALVAQLGLQRHPEGGTLSLPARQTSI